MLLRSIYYLVKPLIPRNIQLLMRRLRASRKRTKFSDVWPINEEARHKPDNWNRWPENKKFAVMLTHDVESEVGLNRCRKLIDIEKRLGFRSVFNFVPKKYDVPNELREHLVNNGFEVGLHGLYHDGKLFRTKKIFNKRAQIINKYINEWSASGFRSPAMHHNLDWMSELNIEYDLSTFDTDPFEPQSDGVKTIFPYLVTNNSDKNSFVELPYTLPQDHGLFIILKERSIDIWKKKVEWIIQNDGMVLLNTHPDYMNFNGRKMSIDEYPARYYEEFLTWLKDKYSGQYWHSLPRDIAYFIKNEKKNITL